MGLISIGLVSGGFDPLHSGHIDMINYAAERNAAVAVALHSDEWLIRKKSNFFMTWGERQLIMLAINGVSDVIKFNDADDSINNAIAYLKERYPGWHINFYNGGDETHNNILEILKYQADPLVQFHFGAGGDYKKNSSSELLDRWENHSKHSVQKSWGFYNTFLQHPNTKLRSFTVYPRHSMTMQQHKHRSEHWYVVKGSGIVEYQDSPKAEMICVDLEQYNIITIPTSCWHRLHNTTDEELQMIEIQFGESCDDADVIRKNP